MEFQSKGTAEERYRLVILTDMENEPDDSQTMVKLLMYSNEIDIEGLIAVTSRWLPRDNFPESIYVRVQAYGLVRDNLMLHASGWPTADELFEKIAGGQLDFGMKGVGDGMSSPGSRLIVQALQKDDPRPIWFAINAGANTLAQALWDMRASFSRDEFARLMAKIRVYDDSGQDDAGAWMCHEFPDLFYIRSRAQVFGLFGPTLTSGPAPWAPLDQFAWAETHVRVRHGILGALFPQRLWFGPPWNAGYGQGGKRNPAYMFLDGGGTTTWLGLANKGLFVPEEISWGGWGGRFSWEKEQVPAGQAGVSELETPYHPYEMYPQAADTSWTWETPEGEEFEYTAFSGVNDSATPYTAADFAPLWRWRDAYTRDFQARMDWCVEPYESANHHPVAVFAGDRERTVCRLSATPGERLTLDASESSDPDGDALSFCWIPYPEAGTYGGEITVGEPDASVSSLVVPADAGGQQIHIVLEVTDNNPVVRLTSYRRIVIDVEST